MTNVEINIKVAELLGLEVSYIKDGLVFIPDKFLHPEVFDPIDDPVQREPIEDALLDAGWYIEKQGNDFIWREKPIDGNLINWFPKIKVNEHRGTASCLAFIEMMESKE